MNQIRIYTAGPWADREMMREVAAKLQQAGYVVECRWLTHEEYPLDHPNRQQYLKEQALNDIEDLLDSDMLVYVKSRMSEGKATELGIAIATLKPIILIGERVNNVFLNLEIPAFDTIEAAIEWMSGDDLSFDAIGDA
jgi:nucleoside 2-deoxyribosyltransferase